MTNHTPKIIEDDGPNVGVVFYNPEELDSEQYKGYGDATGIPFDVHVSVYSAEDGSKDYSVQIDAERDNGAVVTVNLNDARLYRGDPEKTENAAEMVRQILEAAMFAEEVGSSTIALATIHRITKGVNL